MLTGALQSTERKVLWVLSHLVSQNHGVTGRALMPTSHFTDGKTGAREAAPDVHGLGRVRSTPVYFLPWAFCFTTKSHWPLSKASSELKKKSRRTKSHDHLIPAGLPREAGRGTEVRCHVTPLGDQAAPSCLRVLSSLLSHFGSSWAGHWVKCTSLLLSFIFFFPPYLNPAGLCSQLSSVQLIQQVFTKDLVNTRHPVSICSQQPQPDTGGVEDTNKTHSIFQLKKNKQNPLSVQISRGSNIYLI